MMQVISNSVDPSTVREETRDGDRYLVVEDVPFIRAMDLAGGYVPEREIRESVDGWRVALTANHPRNIPGKPWYDERVPDRAPLPISIIEDPDLRSEYVVGASERPRFDGTWIRVDMAVNADRAEEVGGHAADVVEKIEAGEQFDVSSQYLPRDLPPGEYDGAMRSNVEGIEKPDSIALLPHKPGRCSVDDGCGVNPTAAANADDVRVPVANTDDPAGARSPGRDDGGTMRSNATHYQLTSVSPDDVGEWTDEEWDGSDVVAALPNPSVDDDATAELDATHALVPTDEEDRESKSSWKLPFRSGEGAPVNTRALVAIDAALSGARGGVEGVSDEIQSEAQDWVQSMLEAAPDDLFGAVSENALRELGRRVLGTFGLTTVSNETMPAESGADWSPSDGSGYIPTEEGGTNPADRSENSMKREKLIGEITANSDLSEETLEDRCDEALESIHEDVTSNDGGGDDGGDGGDDGGSSGDGTTVDDGGSDEYVTKDELEEFKADVVDEVAEAVTANQRDGKLEELAEEIVANSNEYDDTGAVREDFPTEAALRAKANDVESDGGLAPGGAIGNASPDVGGADDLGDDVEVSGGVLTE